MKKKQILLKKLEKQNGLGSKMLHAIDQYHPSQGLQGIVDNFLNKRNHEENLQDIDPQLLEIVFTDLMENQSEESEQEVQRVKTDVLTQSAQQLLAFCREKDLVSLHQYCQTIKNKTHRDHSFYGYMLVNSFPEDFYIGTKCTHYHCKTTAHKIQQEYGIFNPSVDSEGEGQYLSQEQEQSAFIVDSNEEQFEQEEQRARSRAKDKRNKKKENRAGIQNQQPRNDSKKKNKMKNLLNSQSEQENIEKNHRKKKLGRMQLLNEQEQESRQQKDLIYEILENLQVSQIISSLKYTEIFQFLSENHREKLTPLLGIMSQTVILNHKKAKRQQKSSKKEKGHKKRLAKSKINLKELNLEDLLAECLKRSIIDEDDVNEQLKNSVEEHPILAYQLLQLDPDTYIIEGDFNAYPQAQINNNFQDAYQAYEQRVKNEQQDGEELLEESEEESSCLDEGQDDQSNYSVDSEQDNLGVI